MCQCVTPVLKVCIAPKLLWKSNAGVSRTYQFVKNEISLIHILRRCQPTSTKKGVYTLPHLWCTHTIFGVLNSHLLKLWINISIFTNSHFIWNTNIILGQFIRCYKSLRTGVLLYDMFCMWIFTHYILWVLNWILFIWYKNWNLFLQSTNWLQSRYKLVDSVEWESGWNNG